MKSFNDISNYSDNVFNYIFASESILKAIAFGFVMDKNSYLRDNWYNIILYYIILY